MRKYKKLDNGSRLIGPKKRQGILDMLSDGADTTGATPQQLMYSNTQDDEAAKAQQEASKALTDTKDQDSKAKRYNDILAHTLLGIGAIIPFIDDTPKDQVITPQVVYNPNQNGTGSQAIYKEGGSIHIKKSKRGSLHKALGVPEGKSIPSSMLEDKPGDSAAMKKKKNFARNAKKWHHGDLGLELGEGPNKPVVPSAPVYQTQQQVDQANAFARDFSKRHNTLFDKEAWVAQKPGDPMVQFRTLDGQPYTPNQIPASKVHGFVPDWVKEIKMDDNWKQPYYLDGNDMVFVDRKFFNDPRFTKPPVITPGGDIAKLKSGGDLSASKAKEMIKDGTAHGKKLTKKQKHYFQAIAHGWKPKGAMGLDLESPEEDANESGEMFEFHGPSHEQGGIPINYMGQNAEVEGGETGFVDREGDLNVLGNMKVPGSNKKFKSLGKEIMKKEQENTKLLNKGLELVNENKKPMNKFEAIKMNTGKVMLQGGLTEQKKIDNYKERLANMQNAMLESMGKMRQGGEIKADDGWKFKGTKKDKLDAKILEFVDLVQKKGYTGFSGPQSGYDLRNTSSGRRSRHASNEALDMIFDDPTAYQKILNDPELTSFLVNNGLTAIDEYNPDVKNKTGATTGHIHIGYDRGTTVSDQFRKDAMAKYKDANPTWNWNAARYAKNTSPIKDGHVGDDQGGYDTPNFTLFKLTDQPNITTTTNETTRTPFDYVPNDYTFTQNQKNPKPLQSPLDVEQVAPEIYSVLTNKTEPVPMQKYNPQLFEPYQISLQDERNANQATFNALQRATSTNPEALSVLAGQKYAADNQVNGQEFRTNQQIFNEVVNKNVGLVNDAQLKNLGIADTQMVRQSTAKSKTQLQTQMALNSVASKTLQNRLENLDSAFKQMLFKFRPADKDGDGVFETMEYQGNNPIFSANNANQNNANPFSSTRSSYDKNGTLKGTTISTPSQMSQTEQEHRVEKIKYDINELKDMFPAEMFGKSKKSR